MGHRISIVTSNEPMQLRITGRYRPAELGPVELSFVNGSGASHYRVAQGDTYILSVPADSSVSLAANATFVPAEIMHNSDERSLSVAIGLQGARF